jgi:hypothetical protein
VTALQVGARDTNVRVRKFSYVQVRFSTHPGTRRHPTTSCNDEQAHALRCITQSLA